MLAAGACLALLAAPPLGAAEARRSAGAEANQTEEYRLKAAYIYSFLGYTTWPKGTFEKEDSPIEILIVGKDPFGELIDDTFQGQKIGKRPVEIRRSRVLPEKCTAHVVFVAGLDAKERKALLAALKKKCVMVIGEVPGFAAAGGTINFYLDEANLRFEINVDSAKASGLTLSSQLLKLAKIVKSKEEDE